MTLWREWKTFDQKDNPTTICNMQQYVSYLHNICFFLITEARKLFILSNFYLPLGLGTRRAVFSQSRVAQPGRGGCVDSLSLLMEKAHNVSSVHRLTLENKSAENKALSVQLPSKVFWSVFRFYKVAPQGITSGPSHTLSCGGPPLLLPAVKTETTFSLHVCEDRPADLWPRHNH